VTPQQIRAQLHSSAGRSSKVIRDRAGIETVVDVDGVGTFVLQVGDGGGYSLRAYPEGGEDTSRDLLAVGVLRADGIVAIRPEEASATSAAHEDAERSEGRMPVVFEDAWARYMIAEQRALVARAEGILARALTKAFSEESREELDSIA
jgi:hypothetical protein